MDEKRFNINDIEYRLEQLKKMIIEKEKRLDSCNNVSVKKQIQQELKMLQNQLR